MIKNALIRRYAVSALRPQYIWVNIGIYGIGLALICIINLLALRSGAVYDGELRLCLRSVYGQLLAIQFLLLWVWGGYSAGNALRDEMLNKSYDFFRLLPLRPGQKLLGVAVGRNLLALALAAVTAVVQLVFGFAGGVPVFLQAQVAFALIATTMVIWNVAVLSSVRVRKGKKQRRGISAVLLLFFALWMVPMVINLIILVSSVVELENWKLSFFTADLPGLLVVGSIALYLALWAMRGATRQLTRSDQPLFSPAGAYIFLSGCLAIALGLFWQELTGRNPKMWFMYAATTHFLIVSIPFGVLRSYEQYMELTYELARKHGKGKALGLSFFRASNPVAWIKLYALWAAFSVGAAALGSVEAIRWAVVLAGCLFFAWAVFLLLVEFAVVSAPKNEKIKFFAGFIAIVYLVLPGVLAGILSESVIFSFSFFGVWAAVGERALESSPNELMLFAPLLLNVLLATVFAIIIRRHYRGIIAARRNML